jgi:hypothetical protein
MTLSASRAGRLLVSAPESLQICLGLGCIRRMLVNTVSAKLHWFNDGPRFKGRGG